MPKSCQTVKNGPYYCKVYVQEQLSTQSSVKISCWNGEQLNSLADEKKTNGSNNTIRSVFSEEWKYPDYQILKWSLSLLWYWPSWQNSDNYQRSISLLSLLEERCGSFPLHKLPVQGTSHSPRYEAKILSFERWHSKVAKSKSDKWGRWCQLRVKDPINSVAKICVLARPELWED